MDNAQKKQEIQAVYANLKKLNLKETERAMIRELEQMISKNKALRGQVIDIKQDISIFCHQLVNFSRVADSCIDEYKITINVLKYFVFIYFLRDIGTQISNFINFFNELSKSQEHCFHAIIEAFLSDNTSNAVRFDLLKDKVVILATKECQSWINDYINNYRATKILEIIENNITFQESNKENFDCMLSIVSPQYYALQVFKYANQSNTMLGVPDKAFFSSLQHELGNNLNNIDSPPDDKRKGRKKTKKDMTLDITLPKDCPDWCRIPLPNILEAPLLRAHKLKSLEVSMKAQQLNNENQPTICTYTLINAPSSSLPCAKFSDDSQILATGYENSTIQVWNISNKISNGLKTLKKELNPDLINPSLPIEELENIIFEPEREFTKILSGHTNTVSSIDLLYDNSLMISSSYDCTIRLWSLNLWDILTLYKGHLSPVLDLSFGPFGHYFASCGSDRISRLWSVEQSKTLRLFSGHSSDVSKVKFHPNSNYILTGSDDCSICLWDVLSGKKERDLVFHRSAITALTISSDGKMCASGDSTGSIFISDLSAGKVLGKFQLKGSSKRYTADESIIDIKFGRENSCIAASGLNNKVIVASLNSSDTKNNVSPEVLESIGTFRTKKTPITELHFTYNNLILGVGAFNDY